MPHHPPPESASAALLPLLFLLAAAAVYLTATVQERRRSRRWSGWRAASFLAGLLLLAVAWSPRLADLAHHDLRLHMVQHLLVGMFAPLGLVFGAPLTLALRRLPVQTARQVVALLRHPALRWLGHPVAALLLNLGGMYLLYLTPLYAASLENVGLHGLVQIHFLLAGSLFTWTIAPAIAGPSPVPHRASLSTRLVVLFLSIGGHAALGKLMYAYAFPRTGLHTIEQLQAAAQIMYYGGDLAELLLVIALFAGWYRSASRRQPNRNRISHPGMISGVSSGRLRHPYA